MSDSIAVAVSDYTGLITSAHKNKPRFLATVALSVQPFVDAQNVLLGMPDDYNVYAALGAQLDTVGLWVGVDRYVSVNISGFFSWNTSGLGWKQGIWHVPFTPTTQVTALDDATFRLVILARIAVNNWDGTIPSLSAALSALFSSSLTPGTQVSVIDNLNMTMTIQISGQSPGPVFIAILESGKLGIQPTGVQVLYSDIST